MRLSREASIFAFAMKSAISHSFAPFTKQSFLRRGILGIFVSCTHGTNTNASRAMSLYNKDTHAELPPFKSREEYEKYLVEASGLPKGFATGIAVGAFVPEEAPSMGSLPIKGTIIHLTGGPTENWAAVFTKNKVSILSENKSFWKNCPVPSLLYKCLFLNVCFSKELTFD